MSGKYMFASLDLNPLEAAFLLLAILFSITASSAIIIGNLIFSLQEKKSIKQQTQEQKMNGNISSTQLLHNESIEKDNSIIEKIATKNVAQSIHPDTLKLICDFAEDLIRKLAESEKKYGYTNQWKKSDWMEECRLQLRRHIDKGDPRDVAAYCAFLWYHGESTSALHQPQNIK